MLVWLILTFYDFFAVLDSSPLTVCINCSFLHLFQEVEGGSCAATLFRWKVGGGSCTATPSRLEVGVLSLTTRQLDTSWCSSLLGSRACVKLYYHYIGGPSWATSCSKCRQIHSEHALYRGRADVAIQQFRPTAPPRSTYDTRTIVLGRAMK